MLATKIGRIIPAMQPRYEVAPEATPAIEEREYAAEVIPAVVTPLVDITKYTGERRAPGLQRQKPATARRERRVIAKVRTADLKRQSAGTRQLFRRGVVPGPPAVVTASSFLRRTLTVPTTAPYQAYKAKASREITKEEKREAKTRATRIRHYRNISRRLRHVAKLGSLEGFGRSKSEKRAARASWLLAITNEIQENLDAALTNISTGRPKPVLPPPGTAGLPTGAGLDDIAGQLLSLSTGSVPGTTTTAGGITLTKPVVVGPGQAAVETAKPSGVIAQVGEYIPLGVLLFLASKLLG